MPAPLPAATAIRILDAAEKLFAEKGFNGTSMREITTSAGANLAAANYHFGSKEELYLEVVRRRVRPVNAERLARLEQALLLAGDHPPPLELLLDILLRPIFELRADPARGGPAIVRIISRSFSDPLPFMNDLLREEFQPVIARFSQAARRHVPGLTPREFLWRFSFIIGAMQHTFATLDQMETLTRGICRGDDTEDVLRRLIHFGAATLAAPALDRLPAASVP